MQDVLRNKLIVLPVEALTVLSGGIFLPTEGKGCTRSDKASGHHLSGTGPTVADLAELCPICAVGAQIPGCQMTQWCHHRMFTWRGVQCLMCDKGRSSVFTVVEKLRNICVFPRTLEDFPQDAPKPAAT